MQEWDCAKMARRDREFSRTRGDQGRELSGSLETLAGGACWAQGFRVTLSEVQPHSAPQAMCWGKPGSLFVLPQGHVSCSSLGSFHRWLRPKQPSLNLIHPGRQQPCSPSGPGHSFVV